MNRFVQSGNSALWLKCARHGSRISDSFKTRRSVRRVSSRDLTFSVVEGVSPVRICKYVKSLRNDGLIFLFVLSSGQYSSSSLLIFSPFLSPTFFLLMVVFIFFGSLSGKIVIKSIMEGRNANLGIVIVLKPESLRCC